MHRPTHNLHCGLLALLVIAVASQAVAGDNARHYVPRSSSSSSSSSSSNHSYSNRSYSGHSYSGHSYSRHSHPPRYSHADSRYGHHRGYAGHGYSTYHLPRGYYTSHYYGNPYYYHGGSWYRPYGARYVVVAPPFGIGISVLPPFYTTVWYGGSAYYYADNTYYTYRPERREYVVTEPPRGEVRTEAAQGGSDVIFAYPREGQSEEQESTDRNECHRWAVDRTGFDPTRPSGNVAETDMTSKRVDYRRASSACLEARGYTVR